MARGLPLLFGPSLQGDAPEPVSERKDAARNRRRILDAARRLMRVRRLDEICMDEIAAAAGVGKGTLYRRFADKAALLLALLDEDERRLQDRVCARFSLPRGTSPGKRLAVLWDALCDFAVEHMAIIGAAEAGASANYLEMPPYRWRTLELARGLCACGLPEGLADHLADVLVVSLAAEVVTRALRRTSAEEFRAEQRTLLAALAHAGQHPSLVP